jgi:hypothetical protein
MPGWERVASLLRVVDLSAVAGELRLFERDKPQLPWRQTGKQGLDQAVGTRPTKFSARFGLTALAGGDLLLRAAQGWPF